MTTPMNPKGLRVLNVRVDGTAPMLARGSVVSDEVKPAQLRKRDMDTGALVANYDTRTNSKHVRVSFEQRKRHIDRESSPYELTRALVQIVPVINENGDLEHEDGTP
jgi:hypothetical protein